MTEAKQLIDKLSKISFVCWLINDSVEMTLHPAGGAFFLSPWAMKVGLFEHLPSSCSWIACGQLN